MEQTERLIKVEESVKSAHRRIDDTEDRLNKDEGKIDGLCTANASNVNSIKNLCEKIDGLIGTIKWFIGLAVTICGLLIGLFVKG